MPSAACLLWPLDGRAEQIAQWFLAMLEGREVDRSKLRHLPPPVAAADELRGFLHAQRKNAADPYDWNELRIVFLVACAHEAALAALPALEQIAAVLPALVPRAAHLEVVAFTPVAESSEEEKRRAAGVLRALEPMAGQTRNLEALFLHQDNAGEAPGDADAFDAGLGELLWRTLFADGVSDRIREAARTVVSLRQQTPLGKCCFTTAGARTLRFEPAITRQRLAARLSRGLVCGHLVSPDLTPAQLEALDKQADQAAASLVARFEAALPPATGSLPPDTSSAENPEAVFSVWRQRLDDAAEAAVGRTTRLSPALASSVDETVHAPLDHPGRFAAAVRLAKTLADDRLSTTDARPDPERAPGGARFLDLFVAAWWPRVVETWIRSVVATSSGEAPPARFDQETLSAWADRITEVASPVASVRAAEAKTAGWLREAVLIVAKHPPTSAATTAPSDGVDALAGLYRAVATDAIRGWREALATVSGVEDDLAKIETTSSGLWKRLFDGAECRQRITAAQARLQEARQEADTWRSQLALVHEFLGSFAAQIAIPLSQRLRLAEALRDTVNLHLGALQSFMSDLVRDADQQAQAADGRAGRTRGTRQVLGENDLLDPLFDQGVGDRTVTQVIEQAFAMEPAPGTTPSWTRFASLQAHVNAGAPGADALVERLLELGRRIFQGVLKMGVPEALAAGGPSRTGSGLQESIERALGQLPLDTAQVARLALGGRWQPSFLLRCPDGEGGPLAQELSGFAPGPCHFLPDDVRDELDLTCVIAGFPGLLVHSLAGFAAPPEAVPAGSTTSSPG